MAIILPFRTMFPDFYATECDRCELYQKLLKIAADLLDNSVIGRPPG